MMGYKYWEEDNKDSSQEKCVLKIKQQDDIGDKIERYRTEIEGLDKEKKELDKKINKLDREDITDDTDDLKRRKERTEYVNEKLTIDSNKRRKRADLINLEEIERIIERNKGKHLEVQRLKDTYSRKESMSIRQTDRQLDIGMESLDFIDF